MDSFTLSLVSIAVLSAVLLGLISLAFRLVRPSRKRSGADAVREQTPPERIPSANLD